MSRPLKTGNGTTDSRRRKTDLWPPPLDPLSTAARVVAERFPLGFLQHGSDLYRFNGRNYERLTDGEFHTACYDALGSAKYRDAKGRVQGWYPNRNKVLNVTHAARSLRHLPNLAAPFWIDEHRGGDKDPAELTVMKNGILHLPSRTVTSHTPDLFTTAALPYSYDATAAEPAYWLKFLHEIWPEDAASVETLQEIFGYMVSADTSQQKIFALIGAPRAGKGTILRVLRAMLGPGNVCSPTLASLAQNFGMEPFIGKLAALIADSRHNGKDSNVIVERLLTVSGEDALSVPRKNRLAWDGKIAARVLLVSNEIPRLADVSGALASRMIVLRFTRSFRGVENTALTDTLIAELPGILLWSLDGWDRLQKRGHFVQPESGRETADEISAAASPLLAFLGTECEMGETWSVPTETLWHSWCHYCGQERIRHGTVQQFGRDLNSAAPTIRKARSRAHGRAAVYHGIRLRKEQTE